MRNTSRLLPDEVRKTLLSEFSLRIKESGYSENFRLEVITSGMSGFQKQVKRDKEGVRPLYQPKGYKEDERRKKKLLERQYGTGPLIQSCSALPPLAASLP